MQFACKMAFISILLGHMCPEIPRYNVITGIGNNIYTLYVMILRLWFSPSAALHLLAPTQLHATKKWV